MREPSEENFRHEVVALRRDYAQMLLRHAVEGVRQDLETDTEMALAASEALDRPDTCPHCGGDLSEPR